MKSLVMLPLILCSLAACAQQTLADSTSHRASIATPFRPLIFPISNGLRVVNRTTGEEPIYVVNDVIVSPEQVNEMDVHDLESFTLLTDSTAIKSYPGSGKSGVALFYTKRPESRKKLND